jgi:hypothetical protein
MPTEYCRHIHPNGTRCRSLALTNQLRCFWHRDLAQRHRSLNPPTDDTATILHPLTTGPDGRQREPLLAEYFAPARGPLELDFPALEDRESIQIALSMLVSALGKNRLDPKRAATMLYGLQVASANARDLDLNQRTVVRDITFDDTGAELALDEDPEEIVERRELMAELLQEQDNDEDEDNDEDADDEYDD